MRLPFLQLESDLLAHGAAGVAALLGCPVPQALGHIALLRAWAVSRGPVDAPPDGWVPGANAARLVAAGAQWTGDAGAFVAALGDPGVALLEVGGGGIQVLGMGPYAEAWEKNDKARERLRKFRERNAYETRTSPNVSGQTQTQTHINASATQEPAPAVPERPELVLTAQKPGKPPRKHREPTQAETLYKDLQESRQERCAEVGETFISDSWDFARQNERLKVLCGLPPEESERLTRAWELYLADADNRAREPPWSLAYFLSPGVRTKYETRAAREAA